MKKLNLILIIALFFASNFNGNTCFAQVKKDTLKVLFVGNSYTYSQNLPQIVSIISNSTKTKLVTKKSTIGGAKLSEHWLGERGLNTKDIIKNGHFDIVVLQEQSMGPILEPDSVFKYARLLCDLIKETGAKPYLYLTWARERVPQYQENLNKVFLEVAKENGAKVVPVGPAWALAKQMRPGIELFSPDGSHPSILGTFLTACIFVGELLGEIPDKLGRRFHTIDIEGESVQLMYIDQLDVIFCLKIAKQIIEEYNANSGQSEQGIPFNVNFNK